PRRPALPRRPDAPGVPHLVAGEPRPVGRPPAHRRGRTGPPAVVGARRRDRHPPRTHAPPRLPLIPARSASGARARAQRSGARARSSAFGPPRPVGAARTGCGLREKAARLLGTGTGTGRG